MSVFLAGCATSNPDWCDTNSPIRVTQEVWNQFSRDLKEQIIIHNEYGEELCGWSP